MWVDLQAVIIERSWTTQGHHISVRNYVGSFISENKILLPRSFHLQTERYERNIFYFPRSQKRYLESRLSNVTL